MFLPITLSYHKNTFMCPLTTMCPLAGDLELFLFNKYGKPSHGQPSWWRGGCSTSPLQKNPRMFQPPKMLSTLGCHPLSKKDSWKHGRLETGNPNVLKLRKMNFFSFENGWIFLGFQQLGFWLFERGFWRTKVSFPSKDPKKLADFSPARCSSKYHGLSCKNNLKFQGWLKHTSQKNKMYSTFLQKWLSIFQTVRGPKEYSFKPKEFKPWPFNPRSLVVT